MSTPIPKNACELDADSAASATGGAVVRSRRRRARGVVSDTRAIVGGEAFVALRGEHHDGHAFLDEAARRGAALLIVDRIASPSTGDLPPDVDVVHVSDTLTAWGDLARAHLAELRAAGPLRVVAITGSAGKTTTKQLCAALLATRGATWATPGNLNNLVGVPAVLFALTREHRFAVIECGMSVRGEIERLGAIVKPDVAVITNVGLAHAEGVGGTREDVGREKGALFRAAGVCIFDADDALSREAAARAPKTLSFGRAKHADYKLLDRVSRGREGSRVTIERPCGESCPSPGAREIVELELPFVGEAAAIDLCAALAAAEALVGSAAGGTTRMETRGAIPQDALDAAMRGARNAEGRAAVVDLGEVLVVDDTYNANPASMRAALAILADVAGDRRRVAVLGEMKELGPAAPAEHAALGEALAAAGVSLAIGCGGLADDTMKRAREAGVDALACANVEAATAAALERVRAGDAVLVKGSRSVGAERVVEALRRRFTK